MIKILVSECLCAERIVRYDGKERRLDDPRLLQWKQEGRVVTVCPEVMGGLSTPRAPGERRGSSVVDIHGHDVTNEYTKGAKLALAIAKRENVSCVLFKLNSPSCGSKLIYDGTFTGNKIAGQGIATELLRNNGYQVYGEDDLDQIEQLIEESER